MIISGKKQRNFIFSLAFGTDVSECMIGWTSSETDTSFEKMCLLNFGRSAIHIGDPTPRSVFITVIEVDTVEDQDQSK